MENKLKPYNSNAVKIPATIEIDVNGSIDTIEYPRYGSMQDKLTYIQLMADLNIMSVCDDSIIT